MKVPTVSSSTYGCIRGRIFRSSNGTGDLGGGTNCPPGSTAGSLQPELSYLFRLQLAQN